jgi:trk system potassium uptake protein TrkH
MRYASIQRVVGFLIALSSLMMLPPMAVSWWYHDGTAALFFISAIILLSIGLIIYLPVRQVHHELRVRDGFLIVVGCWLALAIVGALPFVLLQTPQLSFVDALFESMSGLTTTGATIITNIEALPRGILYYRQQLQWLGGMGIIVLAVAILPMLRVGGMQLYRAETPGPLKDSKLTPRITETAKALWLIYLGITMVCALAYWLGGMSLFDAIGHSFSTVAIGGFSTHDANLAYFDNPTLELIALVFMMIAGINFALHFTAWRKASAQPYFMDPELKVYVMLLVSLAVLASFALYINGTYDTLSESVRYAGFPDDLRSLYRGLCGQHRGRHEGDSDHSSIPPVGARNPAADSSACRHTRQDWRPKNQQLGDGRRVGVLLPLRGQLRVNDSAPECNGHRFRRGILSGRSLHYQPGSGLVRCGLELRGGQHGRKIDPEFRHARRQA